MYHNISTYFLHLDPQCSPSSSLSFEFSLTFNWTINNKMRLKYKRLSIITLHFHLVQGILAAALSDLCVFLKKQSFRSVRISGFQGLQLDFETFTSMQLLKAK